MSETPQRQVYENLAARGYVHGWTAGQLGARQAFKAIEEAIEWAECFRTASQHSQVNATLDRLREASREVRALFDNRSAWKWVDPNGKQLEAARWERADVQATLCVASVSGGCDSMADAVEKTTSDIKRGVR